MYHMLYNQQFYRNHSKHKMTTDKQYSLLKSNMEKFLQNNKNCYNNEKTNGPVRYKQNNLHWTQLTEKLNKLGPPYRTIQEWKKVWCDFKRAEKKRKAKSKLKMESIKMEPICNEDYNKKERGDSAASSELNIQIKAEAGDKEYNSQSMLSTYSNEYDNDYSYPDQDSLQGSFADENVTIIPEESSSGSYIYPAQYLTESITEGSADQSSHNNRYSSPPPLQPANSHMLNQTLYTLQNQMEHQTKLLEHLSQMCSTMAGFMERHVDAVEKKTEVLNRQASATERHTSVMNKFIDMIREKMFKGNFQKTASSSTDNSSDDTL